MSWSIWHSVLSIEERSETINDLDRTSFLWNFWFVDRDFLKRSRENVYDARLYL